MRIRNRVTAGLVAATMLVGLFPSAASAAADAFSDVPADHMFAEPIYWMAQEGVTRGCNPPSNSRFCPDDRVTRGQMAAFLVRAFGLPAGKAQFRDTKGHVFAGDVAALADAGITKGCNPPANDRFCPDNYVTRGQMAAFLVRAFGLKPGKAQFRDTKGHVFQADVAALADAGITKGCNPPANDRFCPDDYVTRGQFAAFLYRAFGSPEVELPETPSGGEDAKFAPMWKIRSYPKATYPESGGVCHIDFKAITPEDGWRSFEALKQVDSGKLGFKEWVDLAMRNGGALPQALTTHPDYIEWKDQMNRRYVDALRNDPDRSRASLASFYIGFVYHETLHGAQDTAIDGSWSDDPWENWFTGSDVSQDLVTGPNRGCGAPRNTGSPDAEWSVGPHKTRIYKKATTYLNRLPEGYRDFIAEDMQLYLLGDIGAQGLESLIREMNAYTLESLFVWSIMPKGERVTVAIDQWRQMFYSELWLIMVKEQFPDQWKKLRELGWDDVFAAAWAQAEGVWPQDSSEIPEIYNLVFGENYHIIAEFTGGQVGKNPPPRPK